MAMPDEALVYVVDDDQGMLESTVWLLESVGLKARPFTQGRDFLDACEGGRHACVLLDVRMPGMGGLNVQDELLARGIDLPVIFVSGHADVPIVVRAFKAGAVDFIEKPYNEQLLLDSVQQALDRHARRRRHRDLDAGLRERLDSLTPRERDVLLPLVRGYTSREVAEQLEVSVKTVDLYRAGDEAHAGPDPAGAGGHGHRRRAGGPAALARGHLSARGPWRRAGSGIV